MLNQIKKKDIQLIKRKWGMGRFGEGGVGGWERGGRGKGKRGGGTTDFGDV
jgi:hypothetical protein